MKLPDIHEIQLASIEVGTDRARDLEPAWAEALAQLITAQGLLHPIIVRPVEGAFRKYRLVAGLHRLEGVRINGAETIPAYLSSATDDDSARLEEVMENLGRYDLTALDRCHHLYDLKQIHDRRFPNASRGGGARTSGKSLPTGEEPGEDRPEVFGFAASVAGQIGLSKRTINIAVSIWTALTPASRRRLPGTPLADKQTELKALSEMTASQQNKVVDLILNPEHPGVKNIADALMFLDAGRQQTGLEKRMQALRETIRSLPQPVFDRLVSDNAERMIDALKRQGHL